MCYPGIIKTLIWGKKRRTPRIKQASGPMLERRAPRTAKGSQGMIDSVYQDMAKKNAAYLIYLGYMFIGISLLGGVLYLLFQFSTVQSLTGTVTEAELRSRKSIGRGTLERDIAEMSAEDKVRRALRKQQAQNAEDAVERSAKSESAVKSRGTGAMSTSLGKRKPMNPDGHAGETRSVSLSF